MARKPKVTRREDGMIWLEIGFAASLLDTTPRKLAERAIAGEFRFEEDKFGMPVRVAEPHVAPLRAAKPAAERSKAPRKPRSKTPKEQEAEWARIAAITPARLAMVPSPNVICA